MVETDGMDGGTVGERLRSARQAQQLTLEDVAARTRIPVRHLESIEGGDWDRLPAPTYSMGFAKSYASALGLDRTEIGEQLRAEMGGSTYRAPHAAPEVFEPADPKRVPPRTLVVVALLAIVAIVAVLLYLRSASLEGGPDAAPGAANPARPTASAPATPAAAPAPSGPVVITANDAVWLQVSEKGGATLFSGQLAQGQAYTVPTTAKAPVLKTGKPEAIRISVGTADAPPVGQPATTVRDVSLLPADLLRQGASAASPNAATGATSPSATAAPPR
ncbi:helix-turn-helix domain-containing protein [Sphingomonas ginkgonis]|uniref:Helix-turn-helix domain-containing protein n=1 Tax=Sphingomonas ginkgonis TaxID=2315330 RepID=A0A3R9YLB1_9SPHN|nr:helix-turn-helix domain-containing protein [Sphingomonas ginkgonis]RST30103.1 helix-turn-helix domain-containing protein [Sphingomonas ginkgonis]